MSEFNEADVLSLWRCARAHNSSIPDEALDAMRGTLLATLLQQGGPSLYVGTIDGCPVALHGTPESIARVQAAIAQNTQGDAAVLTAKLHIAHEVLTLLKQKHKISDQEMDKLARDAQRQRQDWPGEDYWRSFYAPLASSYTHAERAKDPMYPLESALAELIEAVDPSIESGDVIADAHSAALIATAQRSAERATVPKDLVSAGRSLKRLASVVRKYGTCAPGALEDVADSILAVAAQPSPSQPEDAA